MRVLRARLYERELAEQQAKIASERKAQVGSGERSEKVRTYNFPQGRVTDHRIKLTSHNLDGVLGGELARVHRRARGGGEARSGSRPRPRPPDPMSAAGDRGSAFARRSEPRVDALRGGRRRDAAPRRRAAARRGDRLGPGGARRRSRARRSRPPAARSFGEMVRRRLRREPVAYILGRKGFRRIELAVDRRVLIPRPETELLVELALELRPAARCSTSAPAPARSRWRSPTSCPAAEVTATDTSPAALEVARGERRGARARRPGRASRRGSMPGDAASSTWSSPTFPTSPRATGPRCSPRSPSGSRARRCSPAPTASTRSAPCSPIAGDRSSRACGPVRSRSRWGQGRRTRSRSCSREPASRGIERRRDLAGIERVVWGER